MTAILTAIAVSILTWIAKGAYDKYISIQPRLFLRIGKPLFRQEILGYDIGHGLTWKHECSIKNNSQFTAYCIEVWEVENKGKKRIIDNHQQIVIKLREKNHLDKVEEFHFEIKTSIRTAPEVLINFSEYNGERVILPGIKIKEPQHVLKPSELNDIRLIVKYENEKGKKFYIKFHSSNGQESNKVVLLKPFWFRKVFNH